MSLPSANRKNVYSQLLAQTYLYRLTRLSDASACDIVDTHNLNTVKTIDYFALTTRLNEEFSVSQFDQLISRLEGLIDRVERILPPELPQTD